MTVQGRLTIFGGLEDRVEALPFMMDAGSEADLMALLLPDGRPPATAGAIQLMRLSGLRELERQTGSGSTKTSSWVRSSGQYLAPIVGDSGVSDQRSVEHDAAPP